MRITIDTPGTQGVAGFGGGQTHRLTDVALRTSNPLAFVYVSARNPKETIANAKSLIITTMGRLRPGTTTWPARRVCRVGFTCIN